MNPKRHHHLVLTIVAGLLFLCIDCSQAQKTINDQSIRYQQERMVFKQWDRNKFAPKPGFLYTNPLYWMTWALHPNYPRTDLRPLAPVGPQSQRLALVAAMQSTENAYKLHTDTLSQAAIGEAVNYSGVISGTDPLWHLYYRLEFAPLLQEQQGELINDSPNEAAYLERAGVYDWYLEERNAIRERLESAMSTTLDRGSRIMAYHRLLLEYRKLMASWEAKKQYARKFLSIMDSIEKIKRKGNPTIGAMGNMTDKQIAERILQNSKL